MTRNTQTPRLGTGQVPNQKYIKLNSKYQPEAKRGLQRGLWKNNGATNWHKHKVSYK